MEKNTWRNQDQKIVGPGKKTNRDLVRKLTRDLVRKLPSNYTHSNYINLISYISIEMIRKWTSTFSYMYAPSERTFLTIALFLNSFIRTEHSSVN